MTEEKTQTLKALLNKPNIQNVLKSETIDWAGHTWWAKYELINDVLINKPSGKRSRGRPQQRWMDRVKNDLIRIDKTAEIRRR